jgi:hypothetical protein
MSESNTEMTTQDTFLVEEPSTAEATSATADASPQWGADAPKGGKTVVTRALKDGSRVPLFLGQTLIRSLRDLGYNSTTSALCEHVDNAIQWGAREIRVYFHQSGKQPNQKVDIVVLDNGQGMAANTLKVAMAFGGSMVFENRSGIGRYGMGMKAAALNIARSVDVYSWQEKGAFYSMTLDVDAIGRDRKDMIELEDPQLSDALPSAIADIITRPMNYPAKEKVLTDEPTELTEQLGSTGTLVFMPNCDRLTHKSERGLVDDAVREFSRVYRRFISKGVRIYVNNRQVEAFDPTFWMPAAWHTRVEGLTVMQSQLNDSWIVSIPVTEGSEKMTEVRVHMYMLPVEAWSSLPRDILKNKMHVYEDHTISFVRNDREVHIGSFPKLKLGKHPTNNWLRVEVDFTGEADEGFGVAANKQGVRLKSYVADAILERLGGNITRVRKLIRESQLKVSLAGQVGQANYAERQASEADALQAVALPKPPTDTPEQIAALNANLRGLAVSLRQEGETEDQAFERVTNSKFLTDYKHEEYAPFYDTDYKFGKLILRLNTAHPFYHKVWQPLADLAKKAIPIGEGSEEDDITRGIADISRKALHGLQLLFLALARAQTQMLGSDHSGEHVLIFRNLRKSWSDVLETQFLHDIG